ncbi:penicillin-binding protein 2 [Candidatus Peregrinibacteria bacterium]|jgi:stage V sporulation protein D (sporulation-specific penicillin-binding protein)|nr:penicillin-binding protein 2 [Candidatus Peregrinibacteria bacterium]MBT4147924.1 penicillin-binding protein 2 [Candidatus Peregrinibacteria bacterium]MBT4456415.1 penicillin-binding protein 2 [Candidatus Peregrinibacteria bacterium]
MRTYSPKTPVNKITFLQIGAVLLTTILISRLFYLQIIKHSEFQAIAAKEHYGYVELPARRGEIIITDYHSGEEFLLATNITLELLYADPYLVENPQAIAETLSPLLFDLEEAREDDDKRISEAAKKLPPELTEEEIEEILKEKTDEEMAIEFKTEIFEKVAAKVRPEILLANELTQEQINEINSYTVAGLEIIEDSLYAHPPLMTNKGAAALHLAPIIEIPTSRLEKILEGINRYTILSRKLDPDVANQIHDLIYEDQDSNLSGLGFQEEYFRYYPENTLAANATGFVDPDGIGQYGIESSLNTDLQGVKGKFQTQKDSIGRQVIVGESVIEPAVDGDDIILTLDRSVQLQTERILEEDRIAFRADSAQAIIMDPMTGRITALAASPSFNPNTYSEVYEKIYINLTPEDIEKLVPSDQEGLYYFYRNRDTHDFYYVFEEKTREGITEYYRYNNFVGPAAYQNQVVNLPYEPGSVFKPLIMAAAIDDKDLKPNSTFNDSGPVGVDFNKHTGAYDYFIHNSEDDYYGPGTSMTKVLERSLNTGMTYVAKTIGPALMYNYMTKFGFDERTDIEFSNEEPGYIEYYDLWTESELATHAFGQGITVTMLQLANAYCALANGGVLMQPHVVQEVRHDDETITTNEPHEIRRVISEETSSKITAMLISAVENGVANRAQVSGHYLAGKTGTSQTYKHGQALKGAGTTLTSFCGYGPIDNPKFVVCVKFDRPRASEWGAATAAVTFQRIADYLFDYYNIPPDK